MFSTPGGYAGRFVGPTVVLLWTVLFSCSPGAAAAGSLGIDVLFGAARDDVLVGRDLALVRGEGTYEVFEGRLEASIGGDVVRGVQTWHFFDEVLVGHSVVVLVGLGGRDDDELYRRVYAVLRQELVRRGHRIEVVVDEGSAEPPAIPGAAAGHKRLQLNAFDAGRNHVELALCRYETGHQHVALTRSVHGFDLEAGEHRPPEEAAVVLPRCDQRFVVALRELGRRDETLNWGGRTSSARRVIVVALAHAREHDDHTGRPYLEQPLVAGDPSVAFLPGAVVVRAHPGAELSLSVESEDPARVAPFRNEEATGALLLLSERVTLTLAIRYGPWLQADQSLSLDPCGFLDGRLKTPQELRSLVDPEVWRSSSFFTGSAMAFGLAVPTSAFLLLSARAFRKSADNLDLVGAPQNEPKVRRDRRTAAALTATAVGTLSASLTALIVSAIVHDRARRRARERPRRPVEMVEWDAP